jgi:hypothetical protein
MDMHITHQNHCHYQRQDSETTLRNYRCWLHRSIVFETRRNGKQSIFLSLHAHHNESCSPQNSNRPICTNLHSRISQIRTMKITFQSNVGQCLHIHSWWIEVVSNQPPVLRCFSLQQSCFHLYFIADFFAFWLKSFSFSIAPFFDLLNANKSYPLLLFLTQQIHWVN